ncbi:MAG: hypothetical protein U5R14_00800 [Gemmatimonadota bacterium]|nr:hypothetical protein [Gemmatimonadota bacterium]
MDPNTFPKEAIMFAKFSPAALLAVATLVFLIAPDRPVAASECGELHGMLCESVEECTGFWFWKSCTTSNSYWGGL